MHESLSSISPKLPLCLDMDKHYNDKGRATVMDGGVSCGLEYLATWLNSCHAADVYVLPMTSCSRNLTCLCVSESQWLRHSEEPSERKVAPGEEKKPRQSLLQIIVLGLFWPNHILKVTPDSDEPWLPAPPVPPNLSSPLLVLPADLPSSLQRCKWDQDVLLRHSNWLFFHCLHEPSAL